MSQIEGIIRLKDNPFKVYFTGATITGEVNLILVHPINIHGVKLLISGKANVFLTNSNTKCDPTKDKTECIRYMSKEDYFESVTYLFGSVDGNNQLHEGYHSYEFSFNLPAQLPSSVEGHFGRIRYYAKAIVEFSKLNKSPEGFTTYFTVHRLSDLNFEQPMIRLPSITEAQERQLCWPCLSDPIKLTAHIPQSGYVCGQNISVTVNITNKGFRYVNQIISSLHLIMKYTSEFPRQRIKTEEFLVKRLITNLLTNSEQESLVLHLPIPPLPPTCTENICRIIQLNYELRLKATVKGSDSKLFTSIPIIIGNIPLRNLKDNSVSKLHSSKYTPRTPEIFARDIGLNPPTYEEATYMSSKKLPEYPVYNFRPQIRDIQSYLSNI